MTSFGYRFNPRYAIKECSSCGTLYTRDCACSIGTVEDKILVPKPPKNCARCTRCDYLVDGPHCQGCALLRQELEENLVTYSPDFQNTSEPSNASTSVVNAPREPYVVKQDNGSFVDEIIFYHNRAPDSPNQFYCFHCKDVLRDGEACKRYGIFCKRYTCKFCGKDAHIGYNCPSKVPVISIPEPCNNQTINELPQALPIFHRTFHSETESPFTLDSTPIYADESPNLFHPPPQPSVYPCEFCRNDAYFEEKQLEEAQAVKAQSWKFSVCYDDDDDEEGYNSLNDNIISELPLYSAVTPTEPIDSLIMGDGHLNTIPTTESDEFIKSCVENLVPNPSESEGENGCDVPAGFTTFSNVLFDDDYDSDSSDDQSLSVEDVREKIYSNPLFDEEIIPMEIDPHSFNAESDLIGSMPNHDSSIIISSKIGSLFDEFTGELTLLKSFPPRIDETDCHPEKEIRFAKRLLYDNISPRPPKEFVSENSNADIESFSTSPIPIKDSDSHIEEIDLSFNPEDPMPPGIEDDDDDSERDVPILKELLDNYSLSLLTNESYHFDISSPYRPPAKPPDGNTGTLNIKMMGDVSDQKVPIPNLTITRILNQEKSPDLLYHMGFEAFQPSTECPMIINGKNIPLLDVPLFHFYPP
nr:hypothetical protein [Tanacetum cinerariifolium]